MVDDCFSKNIENEDEEYVYSFWVRVVKRRVMSRGLVISEGKYVIKMDGDIKKWGKNMLLFFIIYDMGILVSLFFWLFKLFEKYY